MKLVRQFSRVVLPDPVPPEIRMLQRDRLMIRSTSAPSAEMPPEATNSAIVRFCLRNLRIVSDAPSIASGGTTTLTREPSGSRASQIGDDSSTRRPAWLAILWQTLSNCPWSRNDRLVRMTLPSTSTKIGLSPLTMMSAMSSRASSGSSGP